MGKAVHNSPRASLQTLPSARTFIATAAGLLLAFLLCRGALPAWAIKLQDSDCSKCHSGPASDLAFGGASHEEVSCSGCHNGHPPRTTVTIPECGECHEGEKHYARPSCAACHANPHMPLRIVMSQDSNEPCRECHPSAVALIERGGSLHSGRSCRECHLAHRQKPECSECHEPHEGTAIRLECRGCHRPHLPAPVLFGLKVPSRDCAPCHRDSYDALAENTTGHRRRSCVSCHRTKHGITPECATCHGLPHRLRGEALFDNCWECHGTAHSLRVWPGGTASGKDEERGVAPRALQRYLELGIRDEYVKDLPR